MTLHAAHLVHEASHHHTPGIGHAELSIDFGAVMANKDAKVARFKKAKLGAIERGGYEVIDAYARFSGPDTVEADGETYRFTRGALTSPGTVIVERGQSDWPAAMGRTAFQPEEAGRRAVAALREPPPVDPRFLADRTRIVCNWIRSRGGGCRVWFDGVETVVSRKELRGPTE